MTKNSFGAEVTFNVDKQKLITFPVSFKTEDVLGRLC